MIMGSLFDKVYRKWRIPLMVPRYRRYLARIGSGHAFFSIPTRIIGDASADPTEFFTHYDAFAYWVTDKITARGGRLKLLDLGSVKMMNGMLSVAHEATSMVLSDCGDSISKVRYVRHDVADPLPFPDASFDVFTSTASLPLIGLGRYGDRQDPDCLPRLIGELSRVMKEDADLLVSMSLGKNLLNFNNSWFFDLPTTLRIFAGWRLVDHLVDKASGPLGRGTGAADRFTRDASVDAMPLGEYRVIFLHFRRTAAAERTPQ